ncbi:hypothetical protein NUW58_g968 [Xylaria curta]|uniref:Uncharacterized protein n=1 Tax=Xylaria curta TaxID=42375 RepID=A0ACC1PP30_9PEZI|nr:hypothetical protein NUW58_g968 [Xylaria curta]
MSSIATAGWSPQRPRLNTITAANYAEAVHEFVRHPTGVGLAHEALSKFLRRTQPSYITNKNTSKGPFLKLYVFNKESEADIVAAHGLSLTPAPPRNAAHGRDKRRKRRWVLDTPRMFFDCAAFETHQLPTKAESPAQIVLVSGYPSPEWLSVVGAKYKIDPELPARFLHFQVPEKFTESFALPSLPSSSWNILELPTVTIGKTGALKELSSGNIIAMRTEAKGLLRLHHNILTNQIHAPKLCSSVIRNITVLDQSYFAIEQRIWVCLQPKQGIDPWVLIIWTDTGDNGNETSMQPIWDVLPREIQTQGPFLIPATRYRPNTGLYAHKYPSFDSPPIGPRLLRGFETGILLHTSFGRTLRSDLMSKDALYCLTEVMGLAASSENQFLNLIERKLMEYTDDEHDGDAHMLPNLTYLRNVLYRHRSQILRVTDWLKTHRTPQWPTTNDKNAVRSRDNIRQEYDHLLERAHALIAQCQEAIAVLMNTIAIQESRKGIEQSERTKKLAFMALIFAPLSFTTSFFSMNVVELENLRIWQFAVTTVSLLAAALLFYKADLQQISLFLSNRRARF